MQKGKVINGANPDGTVNSDTIYTPESWNDNIGNIFKTVEYNGYSLIDNDLDQLHKANKGIYKDGIEYNTSAIPSQTVTDVVLGSDGIYYEPTIDGLTNEDPVGSGTGNWKPAHYLAGRNIPVDTMADFRNITSVYNTVWVSGYHTKNDGAFGDAFFRLKGTATTEVDNGGTVILVTIGLMVYVYELQCDGGINVKWFGATGDGVTDDTTSFEKALFYAMINKNKTIVPPSVYVINELTLNSNTMLEGLGFKRDDNSDTGGVVLKPTTGLFCVQTLDITGGAGVAGYGISNIKIRCNGTTQYGLRLFGTDALVSNVVVDGAVSGVGVFIGWAWRATYTNVKVTNCAIGVQLNDAVVKSSPVNACVFNAFTIELCTIGIYAVKNVGTTQSVANVFNGLIIEGIAISAGRTFPTFLSLNPFLASEYGMTTATATGAFICEQDFQAVISGWYSENVEGIHMFTGYYCDIQMNTPSFEIEKYAGDLVRPYPMISSNQSPIMVYNARFFQKNLNNNEAFISVNPDEANIFEGCRTTGTNVARDMFTYSLDNTKDPKFYDGSYNIGTYQTSAGVPIKRGAQYANNARAVTRILKYTNSANNTNFDLINLHGIYLEINDDVNRNYYLNGCVEENKIIKVAMANTHATNSVVFFMHSDLDSGVSNNLGGIFNVTIPALTVRTLELVVLGGVWKVIGGGDISIP